MLQICVQLMDTAENARRVENETARHIHRMVKEVANSDLPTYDVLMQRIMKLLLT